MTEKRFTLTVWQSAIIIVCLVFVIAFLIAPYLKTFNQLTIGGIVIAVILFIPFAILMEKGRIIDD